MSPLSSVFGYGLEHDRDRGRVEVYPATFGDEEKTVLKLDDDDLSFSQIL